MRVCIAKKAGGERTVISDYSSCPVEIIICFFILENKKLKLITKNIFHEEDSNYFILSDNCGSKEKWKRIVRRYVDDRHTKIILQPKSVDSKKELTNIINKVYSDVRKKEGLDSGWFNGHAISIG